MYELNHIFHLHWCLTCQTGLWGWVRLHTWGALAHQCRGHPTLGDGSMECLLRMDQTSKLDFNLCPAWSPVKPPRWPVAESTATYIFVFQSDMLLVVWFVVVVFKWLLLFCILTRFSFWKCLMGIKQTRTRTSNSVIVTWWNKNNFNQGLRTTCPHTDTHTHRSKPTHMWQVTGVKEVDVWNHMSPHWRARVPLQHHHDKHLPDKLVSTPDTTAPLPAKPTAAPQKGPQQGCGPGFGGGRGAPPASDFWRILLFVHWQNGNIHPCAYLVDQESSIECQYWT